MSFDPHKLESAIARVEALPDAAARDAAREAVSAVLELHREGVQRLSHQLRQASAGGPDVLRTAAEDELIASLLSLHGVHPLSVESRVRQAVDQARAAEQGAGHVEIISIDDAAIRLRVDGSERLRRAVQHAVEAAAPDVDSIEVRSPDPDLVPLERLARKAGDSHEHCDLCGEVLAADHAHLLDTERRRLRCACRACDVLLDANATHLRPVRRRVLRLEGFHITDSQWEALKIPVGLAFFARSTALGAVVAAYPGPAGAIESMVPPAAWETLVHANSALAALEPDVSALLVHRLDGRSSYYIVSIDECYRLTGLVRSRWQGLTGGDGPAQAIDEFFATLTEERP